MPAKEDESPFINTEKLQNFLSFYKIPLVLSISGFFLTGISLAVLIKPSTETGNVLFSTDASVSAGFAIKADIEGSVLRPGVYEFNEGERIWDAIEKAGGLTEEADLGWMEKNLNKAAKLIDGGKIFIPKTGDTKDSVAGNAAGGENQSIYSIAASGQTADLININSATQSELESLPGIGPVYAEKIINGRPYQSIEELKSKKVIGESLYNKIKDKLTI